MNNQEIYHPYWQDIIKSYFKANGFVKHQIDSFNEFIDVGIQKILNEVGSIEIKTTKESRGGEATYIIEFGKISIKRPLIREHDGTTNILYPQEARNRNLTYHSSLYCDINVKTIKNGEETSKVSVEQLGYIPIMIRSKYCLLYGKTEKECKELGECIYDEGGYFIVNGNEKAIVAQERMPNNIVYCFYKKPPSKIIWQAEIRSQFEYHIKTTSTFYIRIFAKGSRNTANSNPTFTDIDGIRGQITYIKQDIPIIFIFYALGYVSKNEIIDIITNSKIPLDNSSEDEYFKNIWKFLRCSFDEANEIIKDENGDEEELKNSELQDFSLDYIGKKGSTAYGSRAERIKYATQILNRELLPHLNLEYEDIFKQELQITKTKAHFIGYMINKLYVSYLGIVKENDRDHLANKRLDLTGNLLTSLFKGIFKRLYKETKVNLTKSIDTNNSFDLMNNIKSKSITNDIKYALSTGNWGRQTGGTPPKTGVAQQLNRLTFSSGLSHLRRLNTPLNREGKQAKPRQLHSTNWGYVCPAETPEGQGCGLLRNLAITCHISIGSSRTFVILKKFLNKYVEDKFIEKREMITDEPLYKIFLDGAWVVSVDEKMVNFLVAKLKRLRRKLMISFDTCICLDTESKELHIFTGYGRFCRPLLVVENLHLLTEETRNCSWNDLLSKGIIEYIDIAEEEEIMIAMNLKQLDSHPDRYSHLEIHPSIILGICASIIPFPDHNQSPRNIYQASMGKQAMGIYASNFNERFDTLAHVLHYPQKPLVTTTFMKYMRFKELPAGINAIVAIATYTGYNQEDSIIVNKGALDRGLFRSEFLKTYVEQEKEIVRVNNLMEQFEVPNKSNTKGIQHGNYGKLDKDGIIEPGARVIDNDIIIGKTTPIATSKQEINQIKKFTKRDVSTNMRQNEAGVIDKVLVTTNSDGFKYTKVKIRAVRTPIVGDKLASATGDHEILTIKGWKNIKEITLEDKVATLKDGKLVYDHPTEVYAYEDYEGDMYEIKNTSIDLRVSGCHKMFVSKRYGRQGEWQPHQFELARNIVGSRRKYKKDAEWDVPDYFFELPGIKFDTKDKMNAWLIVMGLWIAEGWINSPVAIAFCHCKDRVEKALKKNLAILGLDYTEDVEEFPYYKLFVSSTSLTNYLKTYSPGGALTKFLPAWCFELSKEQTRTLIHGMMLGDGHIQKGNCHMYYTSSDKLADQVSQLALHAGWSAHNRLRSEGLKEFVIRGRICHNNHPGWVITIIKTKLQPEINNGHTNQQYAQTEVYVKHVKEPVYCISVPSEVFYIRRNGKCVWTGNSRHGQKGTIGMVYRHEDMPFTEEGIVPDLIINPHAIPSRMTIGHLIECLLGKLCTITGREGDSTPFNGVQVSDISTLLEQYGYAGDGTEVLYNGESGEPMEARIFIGPTYYQRLKHMVKDKEHSRASGPTTKLTRQPLEGRAKDGGLKLGEMERDVLCSHGAAYMLKDRMFYNSDPYRIHVCKLCGVICQSDLDKQRFLCKCIKGGNTTEIAQVYIPYACKLFFQELMAMSIVPRIKV
jgi:DNA-directed RNA polymerase II subunit RPB2